ncbi:hypothetical protein [Mammaliicoccus stepanovicii]|uniref:hypothetical protein n=1 Tax=Mammaliicoccus stepanovicii TaxID=643214 RepID=UPI000BA2F258|nr:hypothetical protein [Mammaliicoccus stepanovicii]PNZ79322.1 hypothetical protein CD111_00360 [Mammaliicoccus stepanovicii]GGI39239.1 hypothetical protein GCM10010896_02390 [Mammaliicoccus stepanovicii]
MKNKLLLLCLSVCLVLVACGSKEEEKPSTDNAKESKGILLDDKGNPKKTIKVNKDTEKAVKDVIEQNRKSLNEGNVEAYIETIDHDSKHLNAKEEEKVLKDTLKNYQFDKKIKNIKFLKEKNNEVVVFYNVDTTAHPKNGGKDEQKSFNEVVTLVKKDGKYKYSKMSQAAI